MASALLTLLNTTTIPLTLHEALSGIFGSISLTAWIFVLLPQLYENYRCRSAGGVSLLFLQVWLAGDVANLIGAAWAALVPTVQALAVYFCAADAVLIAQVVYYEYWVARGRGKGGKVGRIGQGGREAEVDDDEEEPLLGRRTSNSSIGLPGSHKRRRRPSSTPAAEGNGSLTNGDATHAGNGDVRRPSELAKIPEDLDDEAAPSGSRQWVVNIAAVVVIFVVGAVGWVVCWKLRIWTPAAAPGDEHEGKSERTPVGAEVLGYISAVLYLGARIPQIYKNWREQSCEGLSLLFFLLSLAGNLTYGAGILFHSLERDYIVKNLPWLIGSLGTVAEDLIIFVQFKLYEDGKRRTADDEAVS